MTFQEIKPVETADNYLDIAFKKAAKKANALSLRKTSKLDRIKTLELIKIRTVNTVLTAKLNRILENFPVIKDLTKFYQKLISITIGIEKLKKTLGNINWTKNKIRDLFKQIDKKIKTSTDTKSIQKFKNEFYGRVSSLLKNIKGDLNFLENSRKILKKFPVIKTRYEQIAIAGFPNVGKSTLLSKLSSSKPEIAVYPFTTKRIMIGYINKIQLLDTPGTLNRFNKMNLIEQQAYLVMKLVADKIIYIFDLTEPYSIEEQKRLLKRIKKFKKPIIIYLSKTDIIKKEKINEFKKKYKTVNLKKLKLIL